MKIRNFILALAAGLSLANCADNVEQQAQPYLDRARQSFENNQYNLARLQLDSIKELYPKAFEARRKAQTLLLHVDLAETQRGRHYIDSLLTLSRTNAGTLTPRLYLDKDPKYQDVGLYYASQHRIERNVGRTFMRPQADEKGAFTLVIFNRGRDIKPHALRFTAPDGTFAEVTSPKSHVWNDASGRTERLDFVPSPTESIASFVELHADKTVRVELIGEKGKTAIPFTKTDKQALFDASQLATLLHTVGELEKELQEADRRIEFTQNRLQAASQGEAISTTDISQ